MSGIVVGAVLVGLGAIVHVAIFVLESLTWSRPATWRRFGLRTQEQADTVAPMAFNQGFYNLFLAVGAGVGIALLFAFDGSLQQAGVALMLFAAGSMVAAAAVLVLSNRRLARAAAVQGLVPLAGVAVVVLSLLA